MTNFIKFEEHVEIEEFRKEYFKFKTLNRLTLRMKMLFIKCATHFAEMKNLYSSICLENKDHGILIYLRGFIMLYSLLLKKKQGINKLREAINFIVNFREIDDSKMIFKVNEFISIGLDLLNSYQKLLKVNFKFNNKLNR